jgi:hypothetical protein
MFTKIISPNLPKLYPPYFGGSTELPTVLIIVSWSLVIIWLLEIGHWSRLRRFVAAFYLILTQSAQVYVCEIHQNP